MKRVIRFRLNTRLYEEEVQDEALALDWIRGVAGLKGTKEGCREGDCGACLVLMGGRAADGSTEWKGVTSCTLGMGDLDGRHIVTIEGLAADGLTPVMEAMLDEGASQCGFCSPGFILALTGFLVAGESIDPVSAMAAVEGNLCRCTGYGSIRRAAAILCEAFSDMPAGLEARLALLSERKVLPPALAAFMAAPPEPVGLAEAAFASIHPADPGRVALGGGTDYFVRNPDPEPDTAPHYSDQVPAARSIRRAVVSGKAIIELGAAVSADDFFRSPLIEEAAPGIGRFAADIASPPIRARATLTGNIANASPIADMTAILIALGARLVLEGDPGGERLVELPDFFLGYKKLDLRSGERIRGIVLPGETVRFNFEKAAKRARLDIATVNSALAVRMAPDGSIAQARYAAGGIAPVPLRLKEAEALLIGKKPSAALARQLGALAFDAGSPISDVRGGSLYRRRLMERLAWAHCIRLWPELKLEEELLA
jgi:xanthine dehydrogenase small subunit